MKQNWWKLLVVAVLIGAVGVVLAAKNRTPVTRHAVVSGQTQHAKKLPKLLELGADKCTSCKMMKVVIDDLAGQCKGRLEVEFIDVHKNPDAVKKYRIKAIPAQIFYDENGNEFFRHQGFFAKEDILRTFTDHGIKL